ncbi:glutamine synthetase family protein [Mesorhizobium sp. L48C026A00]|uniref:glutamine synthetase family protein n=1 Tax=Mesorhizobium sp. L48C026A00 TaxID=1287182 RepID=UPI0003CFFB62|nr:glutamine synthetase family protein [Mesorhizobium sp. L48C026A00]ESZ09573.1 glutamine synthetase [Mesorhizobium sp. L48C026A00]
MTGSRPIDAAPIQEAEAFLASHEDLSAFDLVLIDPNGVARGKMIRRHELLQIYRSGRHLPGSILGLDISGADVEETGLVWDDGDADRVAWPIPGSLVELPWTLPRRGEVRVSLYELDGSRMAADPRHALTVQIEQLNAIGMFPVMAFELEFYLLDAENDVTGKPRAARLPLTGDFQLGNQVYSLDPLDQLEPFIDALYRSAAAQDLPVETLISEYAPGQYELTLHHRDNGLRAADDLVMLKRLVRGLALRHGMRANFMAKPFANRAGSGMHLHASLADKTGRNLFGDAGDELAPMLRHAIAGVQQSMADSMLVFAPNLNSWRRFTRNSYAPTAPTWGRNNRSVAIRVPAGSPANRHLEHRSPSVDANPYLVAATVLAGMRHGIENKLEPDGEASSYDTAQTVVLPCDWRSAIDRAAGSDFIKSALGERLASVFVALKRAECDRFAAEVTAEEFAYYGGVI